MEAEFILKKQKPPYTLSEKMEMVQKLFPYHKILEIKETASEEYDKNGVLVANCHKFKIIDTLLYIEFEGNGHCMVFEEDPYRVVIEDFLIENKL